MGHLLGVPQATGCCLGHITSAGFSTVVCRSAVQRKQRTVRLHRRDLMQPYHRPRFIR
jgi:hypothetical protein